MKRIICSFSCFLQDRERMLNVREINILENKCVYYRSNDADGEVRHYTDSIAEFEHIFKINLSEYLTPEDIVKFK